ncbi:MAG: hypothetical protein LLG06_11145 [Desulfobacteraceae bacterium]|nr:hypothetical protein [Desulfobacteraceae bacterium]
MDVKEVCGAAESPLAKKAAPKKRRESIRKFLSEQRGRRFVLDCGHKAIIGDGRSNTIVIFPDGTAKCHNCTY